MPCECKNQTHTEAIAEHMLYLNRLSLSILLGDTSERSVFLSSRQVLVKVYSLGSNVSSASRKHRSCTLRTCDSLLSSLVLYQGLREDSMPCLLSLSLIVLVSLFLPSSPFSTRRARTLIWSQMHFLSVVLKWIQSKRLASREGRIEQPFFSFSPDRS